MAGPRSNTAGSTPLRPIDRARRWWAAGAAVGPAAGGAATVFRPWQRGALLVLFALLVALRLPQAWVHGRFLDEEATVFLAYAWHRPWLDALFRPFAGYWNLGANATTLLVARLVQGGIVPLERAPYLTMTMALAVQLLPAVLILTGRAAWLERRLAVIAALLLIAISPETEEVFLNVLHIQFHLALCTALILALDVPPGRGARFGYGILLFLAPLCGLSAIILLPLFAMRTLVDRDRARLAQLAALAAGTAIQLLLFYGSSPVRGHLKGPGTIAAMAFTRLIVLPLAGVGKANRIGEMVYGSQVAGGTGWWWPAGIAMALGFALLATSLLRRDGAIWMVLSAAAIAIVSFGYGMLVSDPFDLFSVGAGERYQFLPMVLIGVALVIMATRIRFAGAPACLVLVAAMLLTGVIRYRRPLPELSEGPSWPNEVAAWRVDRDHPLAVWPAKWFADLSGRQRPCTPIGRDITRSADPFYCESGWVAAAARPPGTRH